MKKSGFQRKPRVPAKPNGKSPNRKKGPLRAAMGFWEKQDLSEGSKNALALAEANKGAISTTGAMGLFGANEKQETFDNARNLGLGGIASGNEPKVGQTGQTGSSGGGASAGVPTSVTETAPASSMLRQNLPVYAAKSSGVSYQPTAFESNLVPNAMNGLRRGAAIGAYGATARRPDNYILNQHADGKSPTIVDGVHQPGAVIGPGTGTSDSVGPAKLPGSGENALLSMGETVVPAEATRKINQHIFNDPHGLEKATLANVDDPINPKAFQKRINAVGGEEAVAPFKLGDSEDINMKKMKTPLRAGMKVPKGYSDGKRILRLQDGGVQEPTLQEILNGTAREQAIEAATSDGTTQPRQEDTGSTAAASDQTVVGGLDSRLKTKPLSEDMLRLEEINKKQQAEEKAARDAYAAEEAAKAAAKAAEEEKNIFGFADGKAASPLRMGGMLKRGKKPVSLADGDTVTKLRRAAERGDEFIAKATDKAKAFLPNKSAFILPEKLRPAMKVAKLGARIAAPIGIAMAADDAIYSRNIPTEDYATSLNNTFGTDWKAGESLVGDVGLRLGGFASDFLGLSDKEAGSVQEQTDVPTIPTASAAPAQRANIVDNQPIPAVRRDVGKVFQTESNGVPSFTAMGDPDSTSDSEAVSENISARLRQDANAKRRLADAKIAMGSNDAAKYTHLADNAYQNWAANATSGLSGVGGLGGVGGVGDSSGRGALINAYLDKEKMNYTASKDAQDRYDETNKRVGELLSTEKDENLRNELQDIKQTSDPRFFVGKSAEEIVPLLHTLRNIRNTVVLPKGGRAALTPEYLAALAAADAGDRSNSVESVMTQWGQNNVPLSTALSAKMPWNKANTPVINPVNNQRLGTFTGDLTPEARATIDMILASTQNQ